MRLSELGKGKQGVIMEIQGRELEISLMRLGLIVGDAFEVSEQAPFSGPLALKVNGGKVALRFRDAHHVIVRVN